MILHTPSFQDVGDWAIVKQRIEDLAPEIEVRIGTNSKPDPGNRDWQITRPSLVFSPYRLLAYRPLGGTVYAGRKMSKVLEIRRMTEMGLPVPRTMELVPGLPLAAEDWGEYVIVKPINGFLGRGVRLVRRDRVDAQFSELTENGRQRMLVQPYIAHVDEEGRPRAYRVLTMFGEPLYQSQWRWSERLRPLFEIAADPHGKVATNASGVSRKGGLCVVPDVLALARRAAAAFPEIPCLGLDIVRRTDTGQPCIMETNPSGFTWHLSSQYSRRDAYDKDFASAKYSQFNALEIVAEKLIERTRSEAS
ncbi:MAG: hypothetical protein WD036_10010 [Bauldia sp.]